MRQGVREQGREFGDYEVFEELGHGGIGEAYVARPRRGEHAGSYVCLKIMGREFQAARGSRRREAIESLRHEARIVSQLLHPNIARLLDSGAYNDVWFLAFELVEGANLGEILALQPRGVGLAPEHVRRIGIEVAAALHCAHEHDVLHRDIKPSNILVSTDGRVKLVDFGLAKANARHAAEFTVGVGTPRYWAPEQIREEALSAQTDIYALGIVLYELLTTIHPFDDNDPGAFRKSVLRGTLKHELRELGIAEELVAIIECCVKSDPSQRFQSAQALQSALRAGAKGSRCEYDMGEIAAVAREAMAEARTFAFDEGLDDDNSEEHQTLVSDVHVRETREVPTHVLAETVRDGMPGAMSLNVRDEVMSDLSVLAQRACRQRQSHTAHRQTVAMERSDAAEIRLSGPSPSPSPPVQPPSERNDVLPADVANAEPTKRAVWGIRAGAGVIALAIGMLAWQSRGGSTLEPPQRRAQTLAPPAPESNSAAPQPSFEFARPPATASIVANPSSTAAPSPWSKKPRERGDHELVDVTVGIIPYGDVFVDGKFAGHAPVAVKLSVGVHRIVGRHLELSETRTLTVTPDLHRLMLDLRDAAPSK